MPRARVRGTVAVVVVSIAFVVASALAGTMRRMAPAGSWADAVAASDTDLARALAAAGVDPEMPRVNGLTPLMRAANRNDVPMVAILLAAGADLEASDPEGLTATHVAARADAAAALEVLLRAGANVDAESRNAMAAIHHAADAGAVEVITLLIDHGVDVNEPSGVISQGHGYPRDAGAPPLGIAARAGRLDAIRVLLELGAGVDAPSRSGHTALLLAVFSAQSPELVNVLLEANADRSVVAACDAGCSGAPADAAGWAARLGRSDLTPLLTP